MRNVWLIERASSPELLPERLAEDEDEVLFWTADLAKVLRFTDRHLANRFAMNRVTETVCVVDYVEG